MDPDQSELAIFIYFTICKSKKLWLQLLWHNSSHFSVLGHKTSGGWAFLPLDLFTLTILLSIVMLICDNFHTAVYYNKNYLSWNKNTINWTFHCQQFPLWTTPSRQLAVWQSVSCGGTEMDGEMLHPPSSLLPHFRGKLQTAGTYPVSVWPGCCLAHDLFHRHTHIHRHSMCAQTHTHCARLGGIYLCDELILTDCVDPASVTLSRPLWYPLYFTANQLSWKHTYM